MSNKLETPIQYDVLDERYETLNDKVFCVEEILGHKVVFREIWFTVLMPNHISAYVRLTHPFKYDDEFEYPNETYRVGAVFGVDTLHHHNLNQLLEQKHVDARRQITELIQEHIYWQKSQGITPSLIPAKHTPISSRVQRFLNLEL